MATPKSAVARSAEKKNQILALAKRLTCISHYQAAEELGLSEQWAYRLCVALVRQGKLHKAGSIGGRAQYALGPEAGTNEGGYTKKKRETTRDGVLRLLREGKVDTCVGMAQALGRSSSGVYGALGELTDEGLVLPLNRPHLGSRERIRYALVEQGEPKGAPPAQEQEAPPSPESATALHKASVAARRDKIVAFLRALHPGSLPYKSIAKRCNLKPSTVHGDIAHLENAGLVMRDPVASSTKWMFRVPAPATKPEPVKPQAEQEPVVIRRAGPAVKAPESPKLHFPPEVLAASEAAPELASPFKIESYTAYKLTLPADRVQEMLRDALRAAGADLPDGAAWRLCPDGSYMIQWTTDN